MPKISDKFIANLKAKEDVRSISILKVALMKKHKKLNRWKLYGILNTIIIILLLILIIKLW